MNLPDCPLCLGRETRALLEVDVRRYFRCEQCQGRFLDPSQHPTREEEQREYDQHQNQIDDPGYRRFLSTLTNPLLERLPVRSEGLDYGCGPGPALAAMCEAHGHSMTLFDPIYRNNESALRRQYDFITCTEVAEHFHQPGIEFQRLSDLLRPGGLLGVMTRFQTDDSRFATWHYRRDPTHVFFYREDTMRWLAQKRDWILELLPPTVALFQKKGA
ncbi:MAG: class I SAM-dependent methyltransferase [Pseudomonadota bacterium]